ncbi:MAG: RidA family protein [Gammaproteobacteria bacterium]
MPQRRHSWPEGHWDWPIHVTHKHGLRCGEMIYFGGQVDLDRHGNVCHPGDLSTQTAVAMEYIRRVLVDLDADLTDLVKLICFYVHKSDTDADRLLAAVCAALGDAPGPVISLIPLPALAYEHMVVEIEGVAMRAKDGSRLQKVISTAGELPSLPAPLNHALRCGEMIFVGGQTALLPDGSVTQPGNLIGQSQALMERIGLLLKNLGAEFNDVVKINRYYVAGGTAQEWEGAALACANFFDEPGPAATGIPIPAMYRPGLMTSLEVTAMLKLDGSRASHDHVWPEDHWDWPVHLPYKHGIKCGKMIYLGGQVSMDPKGVIIDPAQLVTQTRTSIGNIATILSGFGAELDDVVKVTAYYSGTASADVLHDNLKVRSASFTEPGPASTGIPIPCLAYEEMEIEIEVIAIVD